MHAESWLRTLLCFDWVNLIEIPSESRRVSVKMMLNCQLSSLVCQHMWKCDHYCFFFFDSKLKLIWKMHVKFNIDLYCVHRNIKNLTWVPRLHCNIYVYIYSTVFTPAWSLLFNLKWRTGLQVDEPTFAGLPINLYSVNRVNSCSVSEICARWFRLPRRRRHPPPDIASSFYLFLLWQEVDVPLDLDILFWGGNFASYLTFSIFPRPSSGLNCRSMFCNCVIRPPLRFIVTFLHRSLVRGVINVSRLVLPLWERWRFLGSIGAVTDFVMASVVFADQVCR